MARDYEMEKFTRIKECISDMDNSEQVELWNCYCDAAHYPDDAIYPMDEFDEIMDGKTPWEIARTCFYGDFCPAHDYFWFNGYANAVSGYNVDDPNSPFDADAVAEWIVDHDESFDFIDFRDILDEVDEQEAEEESEE